MASGDVLVKETFLSYVEKVRLELRDKFARAHQALTEREAELLSLLQQLEKRYKGECVTEQIEELNRLKESHLAAVKRNENKDLVLKQVSELDDRARIVREEWKKERVSMKRVVLQWIDGEVEPFLRKIGAIRVTDVPDYKEKGVPVMVACEHMSKESKSAGVFCYPRSIAIESETNNVYICDGWNDRVQVFGSSFEFLFDFSEKMSSPFGICMSQNNVYVTQHWGHCVNVYTAEGKMLKSVGKRGKNKVEFTYPTGVAISAVRNRIYVCDWDNNRIECLNVNLTFNSFLAEIPSPRDVKLTSEEVVVLTGADHCIRYYNYSHQILREMISLLGEWKHLRNPWYFCIDTEHNILMTDVSADCVVIFTNQGEMLQKIGKTGEGRGEFISARGIALDSEHRIIVVSHNSENCLQLF